MPQTGLSHSVAWEERLFLLSFPASFYLFVPSGTKGKLLPVYWPGFKLNIEAPQQLEAEVTDRDAQGDSKTHQLLKQLLWGTAPDRVLWGPQGDPRLLDAASACGV